MQSNFANGRYLRIRGKVQPKIHEPVCIMTSHCQVLQAKLQCHSGAYQTQRNVDPQTILSTQLSSFPANVLVERPTPNSENNYGLRAAKQMETNVQQSQRCHPLNSQEPFSVVNFYELPKERTNYPLSLPNNQRQTQILQFRAEDVEVPLRNFV